MPAQKSLAATIVKAGLLAGTLDIGIACIQFYSKTGKTPLIVLKYIASAFFGKEAFAGGNEMALYGLILHYIIAFGWTIIFFIIYPRLPFLRISNILTSILYGVLVWAMMERVLVPLTKASQQPFDVQKAISAALILSIAVGFPLSVFAKRYYGGK